LAQAARRDPRIVRRGVVPEVADIYAGPAVVVCPVWAGSGLKIKMVEALAHGKAVVATPVAAQGLEQGINEAFLSVDRLEDLAQQVVDLLHDAPRREQLERAAASFAEANFSEAVVWREMDQVLRHGVAARSLARVA
jgi:succinoglycan biosynthesis protein ExoO